MRLNKYGVCLGLSLFVLSIFESDAKDLQEAMRLNCKIDSIGIVENDKLEQIFHLAHTAYEEGNYDRSYELINSLLLHRSVLESQRLFLLLLTKGQISMTQKGLLQASLQLYGEAYKMALRHKFDSILISKTLATIGGIHMALTQFDSALLYLKQWERVYATSENDNEVLKEQYHNIGLCYYHTDVVGEAETYLNRSLQIEEELMDTVGMAISYMDVGSLYYDQYKDSIAIPLFEKGLKYAILSEDLNVKITAHKNMAVVEENRNNFEKAIEYRKKLETLQDSAWNRDRVWELAKQENKFRLDIKDNELNLAKERERVQQATAETQTLRAQVLALVSILLAIISAVSIWYYRNIRRSNKTIENQREELLSLNVMKNKLFSIIAHDLKSPFISIQKTQRRLFNAITSKKSVDALEMLDQNKSAMDRTFRLLDNLLHWAQQQTDEIHFEKRSHRILNIVEQVHYDYEEILKMRQLSFSCDIDPASEVGVDLNMIKVALRNILDNAIKFTENGGSIDVSAFEVDSMIRLEIRDTGVGMTPEQVKNLFTENQETLPGKDTYGNQSSGLGMILTKSLIEKQGGSIGVTSSANDGTSFFVNLPQSLKESING